LAQDYFSFYQKILLANADNICIMTYRERESEKMKIPKTTTIRKSINRYAYKAGFTLHPHSVGSIPSGVPGTYSLFDIHMGYYTHRNVSMDTVVRVVVDEMYAKKFRMEAEASLNVGA
jgi:hypothetical protein